METHDLIIIGGSASATAAGIYAARRKLNFKIISKDFGGEVATSGEIGNWPGVINTDGLKLSDLFLEHLKSLGVEPELDIWVKSIKKLEDGNFLISAKHDEQPVEYQAKAVIVTTGVHPRELEIPGEKEFRNKGVSYCTTCDGPLFGGKTVATIGGGNSALESALMLADIASKVYVINKNDKFKGDQVLIDNLNTKKNVEILYNVNAKEIVGNEYVTGLKYIQRQEGTSSDEATLERELSIDGTFVHIGMVPNSSLVPPEVQKDAVGQIMVNANCETNVPGLYAAGDVTNVPFNQIVIAAGQGTIALLSAVNYLNRLKK